MTCSSLCCSFSLVWVPFLPALPFFSWMKLLFTLLQPLRFPLIRLKRKELLTPRHMLHNQIHFWPNLAQFFFRWRLSWQAILEIMLFAIQYNPPACLASFIEHSCYKEIWNRCESFSIVESSVYEKNASISPCVW